MKRQRRGGPATAWCPGAPSVLLIGLPLALLGAVEARAAAFTPGEAPDPPTGAVAAAPTPQEPIVSGRGIVWRFAPWRVGGLLGLDLRAHRLNPGGSGAQAVASGQIDWASYLWQPWFLQVRFGLGVTASQDSGSGEGSGSRNTGLTGHAALSVFPASRFPFEMRAEVSDSRAGGDAIGGDLRSTRISLSQSWQPRSGNDLFRVQLDSSRLDGDAGADHLRVAHGSATLRRGSHSLEFGASLADNRRDDSGDRSRIGTLNARHGFRPSSELLVDTVANLNRVSLHDDDGPADVGNELRQLSSLVTWRPRPGQALRGDRGPLVIAASARWFESGPLGQGDGATSQALALSLSASQELGGDWRAAGSISASLVHAGNSRSASSGGSLSLGWSPASTRLGAWRYTPSAALSLSAQQADDGRRAQGGLQGSHSLAREFPFGSDDSISLVGTQSLGLLYETETRDSAGAVAHGLALSWQSIGGNGRQSFVSLSASDSRSFGNQPGSFQLVNLQWTQRTQLTRYSSWSANLTLQSSRNESTRIDAFSGQPRHEEAGWQSFASGSASLEQQRVFGVPRLRHTLLASINSQQLERRELGDIDAPRHRISESVESRLDYTIGRLDARLTARWARVDGRGVGLLHARVQRRF